MYVVCPQTPDIREQRPCTEKKNIYRKIVPVVRLGWLAPARQLGHVLSPSFLYLYSLERFFIYLLFLIVFTLCLLSFLASRLLFLEPAVVKKQGFWLGLGLGLVICSHIFAGGGLEPDSASLSVDLSLTDTASYICY